MAEHLPFIALGSRLRGVPHVLTLGVRPNFQDYSPEERRLMASREIIFYPTLNYAQFFNTMGKRTFPSLETYLYADEKIKQTTLFYMLGIPHPRTRIYYRRHHKDIVKEFSFPFVGKIARRSAQGRGVFKIRDGEDLEQYLRITPIAYIQEYLPHRRDLRVVLINYEPVLGYWRERPSGDFRNNVAQGGTINFDSVPAEALQLASESARRCRFDDVGIDLIQAGGTWYVIEANMKYGRKGLMLKGLDLKELLRREIFSGVFS